MKNSKKVLVIGGAGFIGQNVVTHLKEKGYQVACYDVVEPSYETEHYVGDILNDSNLAAVFSKFDQIVYLISSISPKRSMDVPTSSYTTDIPLLLKTLETCQQNNINRIIYAFSGGTIYGEGNGKKAQETDILNPQNHYAICKLACEKILILYNKLSNMENVILRISNPYGKGQKPSSGVGVITTFVNQVLNNEKMTLFGDGSNVRDFINIDAVAEAFQLALEWEYIPEITPVFNVGSSKPLSLLEIINIISEITGIQPDINFLDKRKFDVLYSCLDTKKTEEYLGFKTPANQEEEIIKYVKQFNKQTIKKEV